MNYFLALKQLYPFAYGYSYTDDSTAKSLLATLANFPVNPPTIAQLETAMAVIAPRLALQAIQEQRDIAYPHITEWADAEVKMASSDNIIAAQGKAQKAKYFADCLAVKAKIPKP